MVTYFGDYLEDSKVYIPFNTFSSNDPSASVTVTDLINTDIHIHKNNELTQRNNAAGITMSVDFDGITGNHIVTIDTSEDTVADFWEPGHDYFVRIEGATVDAGTLNSWIGSFSIENRCNVVGIDVPKFSCSQDWESANRYLRGPGQQFTHADPRNDNNATHIWELTEAVDNALEDTSVMSTYPEAIKRNVESILADTAVIGAAVGDSISADIAGVKAETVLILEDTAVIGALGAGLTALATQASVNTIDDFLDTEIAAITAAVITNAAGVDIAADIIALKAVADVIQADTDLLDDAVGGIVDIHTDVAAVKGDTAAILLDTGTDGVVVAAGSKTGYALSDAGVDAVFDRNSSLSISFENLINRIYEMINDKMNVTDATGAVALRNIGNTGDIATGSVTDDSVTTVRAELAWV